MRSINLHASLSLCRCQLCCLSRVVGAFNNQLDRRCAASTQTLLQCIGRRGRVRGSGYVHGSSLVVTTTMDTMQLPPLLPPPGSACGLLTQPLHGKWHGVCAATVTPSPLASTARQGKCACSGQHLSSPSGRLVSEVAPHSPSCGCILRIRPCGMLSVPSCKQPSSIGQQTSALVRIMQAVPAAGGIADLPSLCERTHACRHPPIDGPVRGTGGTGAAPFVPVPRSEAE